MSTASTFRNSYSANIFRLYVVLYDDYFSQCLQFSYCHCSIASCTNLFLCCCLFLSIFVFSRKHSTELSEYGEIRRQVLEFYFSGNIPQNNLSAKNAEFRQADKKARELANAQQTIEEYLRQEQSQDHRKKKRNDLE